MPLTTLDPIPALIVIDLQQGIVPMIPADTGSTIIDNSAQLARAFRQRNLPVVLVNVTAAAPGRTEVGFRMPELPPNFADLIPQLEPHPTDILISKRAPGAFINTTLDAQLRARGVTQLIFTGVATSNGVEASARSAFDHGFHVVFATDAVADRDPAAHTYSLEKIFPKLGERDTTTNILAQLESKPSA